MLTDLLTSSKGPGVIGTVLALIVLVGFWSLLVLVSEDTKGPGLGAQIKKKEGMILSLQNEAKHWQKEAVGYKERRRQKSDHESLQGKLKRRQAQVQSVMDTLVVSRKKIAKLQADIEVYKKRYRTAVRAKAVGKELNQLETKDGEIYKQVKIRQIDAIGMNIQYVDGFARIDYKRLPDAMQDRFQFSEKDASVMMEKEQSAVAVSVQGGKKYKVTRVILDIETKLIAANQKLVQLSAKVKSSQAEMASNLSKIATANDRASSYRSLPNKGLNWDRAKKYEAQADRLTRRNSLAQADVSRNLSLMAKTRSGIAEMEAQKRKLEDQLRKLKKKP